MYQEFKDRAAMLVVYIQEAHASDVWQLPINEKQQVVFAAPRTAEERSHIADSCVRRLHLQLPAVLDRFDNTTERAYSAWPDRIYVIDPAGRVAYKSKPGPFGFEPDRARQVLASLIHKI